MTTLDISPDVAPSVVGSVTELPFANSTFDTVLCAEVLEHIRFDDVPRALGELRRVARGQVVISLPHPGYVFSATLKLPLLPHLAVLFQIPFFWQVHRFNGEHYWELGKRGYPLRRFLDTAREAGLRLGRHQKFVDDPVHRFFVFHV